ncbi:MAG: 30S ribosomal protein S5 [Mycoplasmataceae bacterium]|jgi:small subunit ribosomal protein S5|nr:30S ribosomal protein S5 [Mycoplasmataceae bacterium]
MSEVQIGKETTEKSFKPKFVRAKDEFEEKTVMTKRINKTTKGGRRGRFSALVIVGDRNGRVGYGLGKSVEISNAIKKASKDARKNLKTFLINKRGGLFHDLYAQNGATKILIKTAPVGSGIIAGGVIRVILELAGYKDACSKNLGSNSPINMAQTTFKALSQLKTPMQMARERFAKVSFDENGKKIVGGNLNKLFKGGHNN